MDSDYEVRQECCSWCTWRRSRFFAFLSAFIAITFIAIAAFVPHAIRTTIDDSIRDAVVLTPSSQHDNSDVWRTFASYKDPDSVPVSYSVNLWNITNPAEVIRGEKPIVVEVGPYIFEEVKERLNATFETDLSGHKVVKYWERTYYILDTEKTSPELQLMNQNITNINFLFFGFAAQTAVLGNLGGYLVLTNFQKYCGESVVAGETIEQCAAFQTRTAYEWMFGYIDEKLAPLATPTNPVPFQFPGLVGNSTSNNIITMDNAQYMEMYTGEDLDELSRQYKVYNGTSSMMVPAIGGTTPTVYMWNTDIANRIYGTDGTQFRRNPPTGGSLPCWVSELNRVVTLVNENGLMIDNKGIQLQRYTLDSRTLLNISQVKENSAYYQDWVNGVLNVSAANQYVPIYMSRPNCLAVDQRICDKVIGFHPQTALHETYVDVEPMTGMTFHAAKRLQANLRFPRVLVTNNIFAQNETAWFTNVDSELLLPIFWVDESGEIPDDKAKDFKNSVYLFNDLAKYSQWAFYIVGNLFILLSLFLFNVALKRSASNKNLQHSEPFTAPSNYHAL